MKSEFDKCEARELEPENSANWDVIVERLWEDDNTVFASTLKMFRDDPEKYVSLLRNRGYEELGKALFIAVQGDIENQADEEIDND